MAEMMNGTRTKRTDTDFKNKINPRLSAPLVCVVRVLSIRKLPYDLIKMRSRSYCLEVKKRTLY